MQLFLKALRWGEALTVMAVKGLQHVSAASSQGPLMMELLLQFPDSAALHSPLLQI